jgi:thiol-disulfide isomerase/thioredoxin
MGSVLYVERRLMQTYSYKEFGLDLLIGFAIVVVVAMPAAILNRLVKSTGLLATLGATIFFAASAARSRWWGNPWLHGLGMALGAGLLPCIVACFLLRDLAYSAMALFALLILICVAGAWTRRFLNRNDRPGAAGLIFQTTLVAFAGWHYAVPRLIVSATLRSVNKPAPAFTLTRLDGSPVTLDALRGKVVILDFWATWCAPCQAEMPALNEVYNQFKGNSDFAYIAVDTGWNDDTKYKVSNWVGKKHFPFPVAMDAADLAGKLGIETIPTQVLIDRRGRIRLINQGFYDDENALRSGLTSAVNKLLKE